MPTEAAPSGSQELIVCGWDEVFVWAFDPPPGAGGAADPGEAPPPRKVWSWRAPGRADIPEALWDKFKATDECKPLDGGRRILIASSAGAVALLDRATSSVLFVAEAPSAHSVEMLPGGRIAVALSHDDVGGGDRLQVFDPARPGRPSGELPAPCIDLPMPWGHGLVWDAARERLYALQQEDLLVYRLTDWATPTPGLALAATHRWPALPAPLKRECGHDLYPVPGTSLLSVTTNAAAWFFDRDTTEFRPHPTLGTERHVKSICHQACGPMAYIQAESPNWWAERIHLRSPDRDVYVPGEHFYKARWNVTDGT